MGAVSDPPRVTSLDSMLARRSAEPEMLRGSLLVGEMPGGGSIELPFTLVRGIPNEPLVWVIATRDGDEVHATLAALELQRRLAPAELHGSVLVMPVVNVPGFEVLSRTHPLAPSYLGQHLDTALVREITGRPGFMIDLHSAGASADTLDWTLYLDGSEEAERMARAFGSPLVYAHRPGTGSGPNAGLLDGALFTRATNAGVPAILIEAGGGLPPSRATTDRAVAGVLDVLRELGLLAGSPAVHAPPQVLTGFRIVTPERGGIMETAVALGDRVEEGQVLAVVRDLHGEVREELRAPVPGIVLTISLNPAAGSGTWAFELGW
jgi:predicted deacylase